MKTLSDVFESLNYDKHSRCISYDHNCYFEGILQGEDRHFQDILKSEDRDAFKGEIIIFNKATPETLADPSQFLLIEEEMRKRLQKHNFLPCSPSPSIVASSLSKLAVLPSEILNSVLSLYSGCATYVKNLPKSVRKICWKRA